MLTSAMDTLYNMESPDRSDTSSVPCTVESFDSGDNSMTGTDDAVEERTSVVSKVIPMETIQKLSENDKKFCSQWTGIYANHSNIMYARIQCDELLAQEEWTHVYNLIQDNQDDLLKQWADRLLAEVISFYNNLINNASDSVSSQMTLTTQRDQLQSQYENTPFEFVRLLVSFLQQEGYLVQHFMSVKQEENMETSDASAVIEHNAEIDRKMKELEKLIQYLEKYLEEEQRQQQRYSEKTLEYNQYAAAYYAQNGQAQNGRVSAESQLISALQSIKQTIHQQQELISQTQKQIIELLSGLSTNFFDVLTILLEGIQKWKKETQLYYVELRSLKPSLQQYHLDNWCGQLGKQLNEIIEYNFTKLRKLCDNDQNLEQIMSAITNIWKKLLQSTFLCTDQQRYFIKVEKGTKLRNKDGNADQVDKFKCPKFHATIRLLAGENINKEKVEAYFCREDDIVDAQSSENLLQSKLKEFPLKGNDAPFEKKGCQAVFKKLELHNCKDRFSKTTEKPVCEEKFRIVFKTTVRIGSEPLELWAFSLPLVVITGASQSCNAHGSVLWQCYNTEDAFLATTKCPDKLPWCQVADMLNEKFKMLEGRDLTAEERKHLGDRINIKPKVMKDRVDEEETVHFKQFCVEKMMDISDSDDKKKSATFWMWFFAVFNLTKNYLQQYWRDGLIEGFINKKAGEEKLRNCEHRTFFLRFSDNVITDGQGQSMCGAISASFCYKTQSGTLFDHTAPFKAEALKKKPLPNLLRNVVDSDKKQNLLEWLYPKMKARDEVFTIVNLGKKAKNDVPDDYKRFEELLMIQLDDLKIEESDNEYPADDPSAGSSSGPSGSGASRRSSRKSSDKPNSERPFKRPSRRYHKESKHAKLAEDVVAVASPDSTMELQNELILIHIPETSNTDTNVQEPDIPLANIPQTVLEHLKQPQQPTGSVTQKLNEITKVPCTSGSVIGVTKISKANSDPSISSTNTESRSESLASKYPQISGLLNVKNQLKEKIALSGTSSIHQQDPVQNKSKLGKSKGNGTSKEAGLTTEENSAGLLTQTYSTSGVGYNCGTVLVNPDYEFAAQGLQTGGQTIVIGGGNVEGRYIERNSVEKSATALPQFNINTVSLSDNQMNFLGNNSLEPTFAAPHSFGPNTGNVQFQPGPEVGAVMEVSQDDLHVTDPLVLTTVESILASVNSATLSTMCEIQDGENYYNLDQQQVEVMPENPHDLLKYIVSETDNPSFDILLKDSDS